MVNKIECDRCYFTPFQNHARNTLEKNSEQFFSRLIFVFLHNLYEKRPPQSNKNKWQLKMHCIYIYYTQPKTKRRDSILNMKRLNHNNFFDYYFFCFSLFLSTSRFPLLGFHFDSDFKSFEPFYLFFTSCCSGVGHIVGSLTFVINAIA